MPDLSPEDLATLQTALLALAAAAFSALAILAIAAGRKALSYLSALTGIKQSEALNSIADNAITASIHYAEEWTDKQIRKLGQPVGGAEKREVAKTFARSIAPQALAHVTEDQLDMLVDAKVQSMRPFMPSSPPAGIPSVNPPGAGTTYRATSLPPLGPVPSFPSSPTPVPPKRT